MNEVDRYLNEVTFAMGGSFAEQQAARDELRADLDAAVRELTLQGLPPDAAIARAIVDMGEPAAVGRALRASRRTRPLRRPLLQPEGAVLIGHRRIVAARRWPLLVALGAAAAAYAVLVIVYLWPS